MNKFGTGGWALLAATGCQMEAQGTWNHFTKHCESIVSPNRQVNIKFEGQGTHAYILVGGYYDNIDL